MRAANMRATVSVPPPGENGEIKRTGLLGKSVVLALLDERSAPCALPASPVMVNAQPQHNPNRASRARRLFMDEALKVI